MVIRILMSFPWAPICHPVILARYIMGICLFISVYWVHLVNDIKWYKYHVWFTWFVMNCHTFSFYSFTWETLTICAGGKLRDNFHFFWMYFLIVLLALCLIFSLFFILSSYYISTISGQINGDQTGDTGSVMAHHQSIEAPAATPYRQMYGTATPAPMGALAFSGTHPTSDPVLLRKAISIY